MKGKATAEFKFVSVNRTDRPYTLTYTPYISIHLLHGRPGPEVLVAAGHRQLVECGQLVVRSIQDGGIQNLQISETNQIVGDQYSSTAKLIVVGPSIGTQTQTSAASNIAHALKPYTCEPELHGSCTCMYRHLTWGNMPLGNFSGTETAGERLGPASMCLVP